MSQRKHWREVKGGRSERRTTDAGEQTLTPKQKYFSKVGKFSLLKDKNKPLHIIKDENICYAFKSNIENIPYVSHSHQ